MAQSLIRKNKSDIVDALMIVAGVAGLWYGTQLTIRGALFFAKKLEMSEFVVGVVILSVGSDIPELAIAINATVRNFQVGDSSGVVVGTAIGSSLGQIGFVLGIVGLFGYQKVAKRVIYQHGIVMLGSIALLAFAGWDETISRTEGAGLTTVYLMYFVYLLSERRGSPTHAVTSHPLSLKLAGLNLAAGLLLVAISSEVAVNSAVRIAEILKINQTLIGIFLIGIGSSLPELSISLAAVLKKKTNLSVGNLVGSNIFDTLVPIGVGGAISTLNFSRATLFVDIPVLFVLSALVLYFLARVRGLQKWEASAVLGVYLTYAVFRVAYEI